MAEYDDNPRDTHTFGSWSPRLVAIGLVAVFAWACSGEGPPAGNGDDSEDTGTQSDGQTIYYDTGADAADDASGSESDADGGADTGDDDPDSGAEDGDTSSDCENEECTPSEVVCTEHGLYKQCIRDRNGCGHFDLPEKCPEGQTCSAGSCQDKNPCNTGENDCDPDAICKPTDNNDQGYTCDCGSYPEDYFGDGTLCYDPTNKLIEPGSFEMGSPGSENGADDDEARHTVELTRPFLITQIELPRSKWSQHLPNADDPTKGSNCDSASCPMRNITWWAALRYLNKRSEADDLETCYTLNGCSGTPGDGFTCSSVDFEGLDCNGWRLPTEAEWEYAARAGTQKATYEGDLTHTGKSTEDSNLGPIAWYAANSEGRAHGGSGKTPNPWGLYDPSGNVAEWTWDRYKKDLGTSKATDPTGPNSGNERVVRGGSYDDPAAACRSAARDKSSPGTRSDTIGFRPVRTMPPKPN